MSEFQQQPKSIVILGGGSAGWMAASLLQQAWQSKGCQITVLESDKIGTVGVGEGSTPSLKLFFEQLNIPEQDWMPACNATYKTGIAFPNWTSHLDSNSYFHPFYSSFDWKTGQAFIHNCNLKRKGYEVDAHPDSYWLQTKLAEGNLSPVLLKPQQQSLDYGYHFDSAKLGQFLKQRAIHLGAQHLIGTVETVNQAECGSIKSLTTSEQTEVAADFFVDCSGFAGLLISKTLKVDYQSFANELLNDRAIALPCAIDQNQAIPPTTRSTALSNGWCWQIPLSNRYGNGYVYSSKHISDEDALVELKQHLNLPESSLGEPLFINMKLGRNELHWHKNVLAVGLSQGFIEPLEATALSTMQYTVEHFIRCYANQKVEQFNTDVNQVFDSIKDYITCHYRLNTRTDSEYWQDNRDNQHHSSRLQALFDSWRDANSEFEQRLKQLDAERMYFSPSWYCLFSGKGRYNGEPTPVPTGTKVAPTEEVNAYCLAQAENFRPHNEQLKRIYGGELPPPMGFN